MLQPRAILGGRYPNKMKKRESSYFIFVFALMINFKFFACEPTIVVKNNETNDKFYRKVAFPRYTESVKFMSQS